jgi:hypothetical protein
MASGMNSCARHEVGLRLYAAIPGSGLAPHLAPSLFWLDFKEANFKPGASVLPLNLHDPKIGGDAREFLKRWRAPS